MMKDLFLNLLGIYGSVAVIWIIQGYLETKQIRYSILDGLLWGKYIIKAILKAIKKL